MSNRLNARQWSPPDQNITVHSFDIISIVLPFKYMCFDFHLKLTDVLYYGLLMKLFYNKPCIS